LTENSSQNAKYEPPKKAMKLTKYNRIESPSSTPKKLQKKASPNVLMSIDLSNEQPTCSRNLRPSTSNVEPNVKINKLKEESNVQLGNRSPKASSSGKSRRESFSLIPCLLGMDLDFIPNMKPFECKICFETIEPGNGIILYECLHEFCKGCLSGLIEAAEEFQVKCPWDKCKENLREREVKSLVSNEVFEKHLQKSLKIAEHGNELAFHCRTPDCPIFMEIGADVPAFTCPSCRKVNCISCKAIHEGKSCKDYQEEINPKLKTDRLNNENLQSEDAIKKLIATNQAMYCPKCSIPVMKISGCDFISCTACKLGKI